MIPLVEPKGALRRFNLGKTGMYYWKMLRSPTCAALCLAFVSATAASAQSANPSDGSRGLPNLRVQMRAHSAHADPAVPRALPEANFFEGTKPGLGISRQSYREQDGSASIRSGIVRSWSVAEGMSAGLGLFSVTHEDQEELEFRRNWSAKNIGPRNRKVAAVGLNVSF